MTMAKLEIVCKQFLILICMHNIHHPWQFWCIYRPHQTFYVKKKSIELYHTNTWYCERGYISALFLETPCTPRANNVPKSIIYSCLVCTYQMHSHLKNVLSKFSLLHPAKWFEMIKWKNPILLFGRKVLFSLHLPPFWTYIVNKIKILLGMIQCFQYWCK